jgi:hypothetical protein
VSRLSKFKIYKTVLKPVMMHECETGSIAEKKVNRNILRKVYGTVTEQIIWRIRTNQELRKQY